MQYRLAQIEEIKELNDEIKELRKIIDQLMVSEEIQENRGGWPDTDSELGFPAKRQRRILNPFGHQYTYVEFV